MVLLARWRCRFNQGFPPIILVSYSILYDTLFSILSLHLRSRPMLVERTVAKKSFGNLSLHFSVVLAATWSSYHVSAIKE